MSVHDYLGRGNEYDSIIWFTGINEQPLILTNEFSELQHLQNQQIVLLLVIQRSNLPD